MTGILAIDTATEACSAAVYLGGEITERFEIAPRKHNQRLFVMLADLLSSGDLRRQGITAIAYGCGPGSFTGLRIAASAVQGLAYANELPCIPVSTLLTQVQSAYREELITANDSVLTTLDARINEVYWAVASIVDGLATLQSAPAVCKPEALLSEQGSGRLCGIGDGLNYFEEFPRELRARLDPVAGDLLPRARDMMPFALRALQSGALQAAHEVSPVYVRDEISWKKLEQQGPG